MRKLNTKDIGIRMALAGIGTALGVVFIALSYYLSVMTLTFTVLTAVGVMCPLSKDYYREGVLCAVVTGLIGFFIANIKIVPYAMVSGLYVVLTVFLYNYSFQIGMAALLEIIYRIYGIENYLSFQILLFNILRLLFHHFLHVYHYQYILIKF